SAANRRCFLPCAGAFAELARRSASGLPSYREASWPRGSAPARRQLRLPPAGDRLRGRPHPLPRDAPARRRNAPWRLRIRVPRAPIPSASGCAGAEADWIVSGSVLRRSTKTTVAADPRRRRIEMLNRLIDSSLCTHGCQQLYTIEPLYTIDPCVYSPLAVIH